MARDSMSPWYGTDDDIEVVAPPAQVEIDDQEAVGTILGPDGEPLHTVFARPRVPFGFNLS